MKAVCGLGNPGGEYAKTRHNIGFAVVLRLAARSKERWSEPRMKKFGPIWARQTAMVLEAKDGTAVALLPQMYMNNSGGCIQAADRSYSVKPEETLVICDEVQLPAGGIRFGKSGSAGGHNGLESVVRGLGTEDFPRLRIGVGPKPASDKLKDFVLGEFGQAERPVIEKTVNRAAEAVEYWLANGTEAAMNRYNTKAT